LADLSVHYSTGKDNWGTPADVFAKYDALFNFSVDGAAEAHNALLPRYWGIGGERPDFLATGHDDWLEERVWINPPYSRGAQGLFVRHAMQMVRHTNSRAGLLLPARTDTILWHECIWDRVSQRPHPWVTYFDLIKGRIQFVGAAQGAPFPSVFVVFGAQQ
jgi:phage N-6-adenine-methyltransferase